MCFALHNNKLTVNELKLTYFFHKMTNLVLFWSKIVRKSYLFIIKILILMQTCINNDLQPVLHQFIAKSLKFDCFWASKWKIYLGSGSPLWLFHLKF